MVFGKAPLSGTKHITKKTEEMQKSGCPRCVRFIIYDYEKYFYH